MASAFDDRSPMRAFYESLTARKIVCMKGEEQESHALEFKQIKSNDLSDRNDKENFAAGLSGFSNGNGGVIIWGVNARKNAQGIDQVVDTPGVTKPKALLSRLIELTGLACSPAIVGVEHRVITGSKNPSFVATLVPASDAGPHMCMLGSSTYRYFVRSGGSFAPMQHFQVADMFGRRARPLLSVDALPGPDQYNFRLRISNSGRGAAQAPFFEFSVNAPFSRRSILGGDHYGLPWVPTHGGGTYLHAGGMDSIIHPTMFVDICAVGIGQHNFAERVKHLGSHCIIKYKTGALGVAPLEGAIEIPLSR
jgi:hypothetical protein